MPRQLHFREERTHAEAVQQRIDAPRHPLVLILDGLSNPNNVGSIFRLADAARVQHVFLFGMEDVMRNKKFLKAARTTHRYVPWSYLLELSEIESLKTTYQLVGLEVTDNSTSFREFQPSRPVALVIGNEKRGVRQALLDLTEACIHLPMYGLNTSMNVAMATGIAVYDLMDKLKKRMINVKH